jgi:tetratricopeptide (TPR) repeat protein
LLNAKGRLLLRLGRNADAKACFVKADELAPQNIERLNELATAYLHLKDPDNAVRRFKNVLDLNPDKPDLKFEMFSKLYEHGYDDHAVNFGKQTAKPMEIVRHYNNKGVMLSKDGQVEQALTEYNRALRFFPQFKENYRIYFNIALAYLQMKKRESYVEAQKHLKKCLELSPEFDKAKRTLEQVEAALGGKKAEAS